MKKITSQQYTKRKKEDKIKLNLKLSMHAIERILERCFQQQKPYEEELKERAIRYFEYAVKKNPLQDKYYLEDFDLEAVVKDGVVVTVRPIEQNYIPYERLGHHLKGKKYEKCKGTED